ncbi:hypothetical protein H4R19_005836 [Coemansia spiralis]|nr:hypothetical protein H4R19_005836 [Coemansia spiralis]
MDKAPQRKAPAQDGGDAREDDPGLLARVADSATRLASGIASSSTRGVAAADPALLAEAKADGPQERGASASRDWAADRVGSSSAVGPSGAGAVGPSHAAAASFRRAAHTAPGHAMGDGSRPAASHQVSLAQSLDGRSVAEFLEQRTPAAMSTGGVDPFPDGLRMPARQHRPQAAGVVETTDPVAYLQGSTYATDMERSEQLEPQSGAGSAAAMQASPATVARGWDEHGASVLEEWQLNEAWDRAWMNTAWSSARTREKAADDPVATVAPAHKNLSYLLKPRI